MKIYSYVAGIYFCIFIVLLVAIGCGQTDISTVYEVDDYTVIFEIPLPNRGQCVLIPDGFWVENEGNHADIYDNALCSHADGGVVCNDVYEGDACVLKHTVYTISGEYGTMVLYGTELR